MSSRNELQVLVFQVPATKLSSVVKAEVLLRTAVKKSEGSLFS